MLAQQDQSATGTKGERRRQETFQSDGEDKMMLGDASWQRPHRIEGAKPGRQDEDADEMEEDEELIDEEEGLLEDEDLEDDTDESPTR